MYSRITRSCRRVALLVALFVFVALFTATTSAQASVQSAWETTGGGDHLTVGPDNLPRVLNCGNGGVESYQASGDASWSIAPGTPTTYWGCGNMGGWSPERPADTISASGNMVGSIDTNGDYVSDTIELWDSTGDLLWQYTVLDECSFDASFGASPVMSGGLVVFTYRSCLSWGDYNIMALDEGDHTVVYDIPLGRVDNTSYLTLYEEGVALVSYGERRYVSNSGIVDQDRSLNSINGYFLTQHIDGSVIYFEYDSNDPNLCRLVFHRWDVQDIQKTVDCESQFYDAKTLPNGDLVAITDYGSDTSSGFVTIFHQSNVQDTVIEVANPAGAAAFYGIYGTYVDVNGNILVSFAHREDEGIYPFIEQYYRTAFNVYDASGNLYTKWSSTIYGKVSVSSPTVSSISLANGSVYFNDLSNNRLVSIQIPGISISYVDSVRWGVSGNVHQGASFVALGDSYSSGEGSFNYDIDDSQCHRSSDAYAFFVADELEFDDPLMAACSGAVTDDIVSSSVNKIGQVKLLGPSTQYTTITIGGNDAGFAQISAQCAANLGNAHGWSCSTNNTITSDLSDRMAALRGDPGANAVAPNGESIHSILSVIEQLASGRPGMQIYVAGYPHLFGSSVSDFSADVLAPGGARCNVAFWNTIVSYSYTDTQWMNDKVDQLNGIINNAVLDARDNGVDVTYVPPASFGTHGLCDSSASYIHGIYLSGSTISPDVAQESLHPTTDGMDAYGRDFEIAITNHQ